MTRSKTGSLTPRTFNIDDLKRRSTAILSKAELEKLHAERKDMNTPDNEGGTGSRLTRLKAQQIASGEMREFFYFQLNFVVLMLV